MKRCCKLCHRLYEDGDNYVDVLFEGQEFSINKFEINGVKLSFCKDCNRAVALGYSLNKNRKYKFMLKT